MRRNQPTRSQNGALPSKNGQSGKPAAKPGQKSRPKSNVFDEPVNGHGEGDDVEHAVGHEPDVDAFVDPDEVVVDDDVETELDFDSVGGSSESHIDDPIRMYLMQMGEIPMLNREREISSAKTIEGTRTHFRRTLLANDFVLQGAVDLLEKVRDGELRLDRTIEVSVTNTAEKKRTLKRIVPEPRHDQASAAAQPERLPHRRQPQREPDCESDRPGGGSSPAATRSSGWSKS